MLTQLRKNSIFETLFFAGYFAFKKFECKDAHVVKKKSFKKFSEHETKEKLLKDYNIAIICDELTYVNFAKECNLYVLTPNNWKNVFAENKIDLFLCESAWNGLDRHKKCWRGRIYKNHDVLFETRKTLFQILDYCKENQIPTAFWNKEDPTYFEHKKSDFVDTALKFQYIFTTAEECVTLYEQKGHNKVYILTFGFSPQLYNPLHDEGKKCRAVFAGSWYGENEERCQAEAKLFEKVLEARKNRKYPERFKPYVQAALTQQDLAEEFKRSKYAININTVTESSTMLARRVYELMASNVYIISNETKALQLQFAGKYCREKD